MGKKIKTQKEYILLKVRFADKNKCKQFIKLLNECELVTNAPDFKK